MPRKQDPEDWLPNVEEFLDRKDQRVFSYQELSRLFNAQQSDLRIPGSTSFTRFLTTLVEQSHIQEFVARRENRRSSEGAKKRYVWRHASPYSLGTALVKGSYLSHASAMFLHALTDQIPKTIYVNKEQSPKPTPRGSLSQPAIDRAFESSPRTSKYIFATSDYRYVLLSGKNTGRLEVTDVQDPFGDTVYTTKIERTLIDIVVRPTYSGGVFEVLRAYKTARDRISVNTLFAMLKKLQYVYPYHQSIGFLMERAGYSEAALAKCDRLGIQWDFYLHHKIKNPSFNERWRLHYPQGL